MQYLWDTYYVDARKGYPIEAHFGPRARYRYGSIYSIGVQCHILINRLFAHPDVPDYVIDATLVHELAHYVHGYGSGMPKLYSHPHRGGVVDIEMKKRSCWFLEEIAGEWRKNHWPELYTAQAGDAARRRSDREKRNGTRWEMYLNTPGFRTEESLQQRLNELAPAFGHSEMPFHVGWLQASVRRNGLSYRFDREGTVRIHGTLSDLVVPEAVIDYELSYWLATATAGNSWRNIEQAMKDAGVWKNAQKAIQWRRKVWPQYYQEAHPLRTK
jgi:hypothetical protein